MVGPDGYAASKTENVWLLPPKKKCYLGSMLCYAGVICSEGHHIYIVFYYIYICVCVCFCLCLYL